MATIIQSGEIAIVDTVGTLTLPADPVAGSTLVLVTNSLQTFTTPAGWTPRASFIGDQAFYVWDKVSVGAADRSVTLTPSAFGRIVASMYELNAADVTGFGGVSTVNGASSATSIPVNGLTVSNDTGAFLLAVGAMHGWMVSAPATTPSYTNGFSHVRRTASAGTGNSLVGHYVGSKVQSAPGASGTLTISTTATVDNNASFLLAYNRTLPTSTVPITTVNSTVDWIATGGTPLAVLTDESDATNLTTKDTPTNVVLDVTLGAMVKPATSFLVRVRASRSGTTGTIVGKLYNGATLVATAPAVTPPQDAFGDLLLTFAAADIAGLTVPQWASGLRLTLTATAT
jgi:hypothetical protein